jgi:hypothetical protein
MKLSTPPMIPGMIFVPMLVVPVMVMAPIPPVPMEIIVMYPMVAWRQTENVVRGYDHNRRRNKRCADRYPGVAVNGSPEPVVMVEAIPVAAVKIKAYRVWNQIDIACSTWNYHYIRRPCKVQRRGRANINVDIHLGLTNVRDADDKKERNQK